MIVRLLLILKTEYCIPCWLIYLISEAFDEQFLKDIAKTEGFIKLCDNHNQPSLSRLINSLKKQKFRSKKTISQDYRIYKQNLYGKTIWTNIDILN